MLTLTRKVGDEIVIGDNITVCVSRISRDTVRLGVTAPRHVTINRAEVEPSRDDQISGKDDIRSDRVNRLPGGVPVLPPEM